MRLNSEYHGSRLIIPLYLGKFLQTCWNAKNIYNSLNGWTLVSGLWAMWYLNLRRLASGDPDLYIAVINAMTELVFDHPEVECLIGIEMAGIPFSSAVPPLLRQRYGRSIKSGYTRPFKQKARKPEEIIKILDEHGSDLLSYGEKDYVEADFEPGERIALIDDMATTLGSKIIRRSVVLWEAEKRGIDVTCNDILYFLDRGNNNKQQGLDFAEKGALELKPAPLNVDYVININEHLPLLKKVMRPAEYATFSAFQKNPGQFQDESAQKEVLAQVAKDLKLAS